MQRFYFADPIFFRQKRGDCKLSQLAVFLANRRSRHMKTVSICSVKKVCSRIQVLALLYRLEYSCKRIVSFLFLGLRFLVL